MNNIKDIVTTLNLYVLKKDIIKECNEIDYNEYNRLKNQKKIYDCLECNNTKDGLTNDLLNDIKKYNTNKKCINKYELIKFYEKLQNKN
jgi:hypothetical protein